MAPKVESAPIELLVPTIPTAVIADQARPFGTISALPRPDLMTWITWSIEELGVVKNAISLLRGEFLPCPQVPTTYLLLHI